MRALLALLLIPALAPAQVPFAGTVVGTAGSTGQVLYASTTTGLFKSIDAGANWTPLYVTEAGLPQPRLVGFDIDPQTESTLYLSTTIESGAIWKSTDAGLTWTNVKNGLPTTGNVVDSVFVIPPGSPSSPIVAGTVYARIGAALYKTQDRGANWTRQSTLPATGGHFDVNLSTPTTMYFASGDQVWRSQNEGATWTQTATLQVFESRSTGANCIASQPASPNVVFVCVAGSLIRVGNQNVTGVHKSVNGGVTFQPPAPLPALANQPIGIRIDPLGPNVYTVQSSGGYCRSRDSGGIWTCPPDSIFGAGLNPTSARLDYLDPKNPMLLYGRGARTSTVMFRSRDAAESWAEMTGQARPTLARPPAIAVTLAEGSETVARLNIASSDLPAAAMPFTATTAENWISLSAAAGTTPAMLNATLRTAGLSPGVYDGSIRIASPQAANQSVTIAVRLTVPVRLSTPGPAYLISTLAGNGANEFSGDGGPATSAGIGAAIAIAVDRERNVYFAAPTHHRVRRIVPSGRIETVAGTGTAGTTGDGGPATQAALDRPSGIAVDRSGALFVIDGSRNLRRVVNGAISAAAPASAFISPSDLAVDPLDRLWILDLSRFQRYTPPAGISTLATPGFTFIAASDIAFDAAGNMYVTDSSHRVMRVTTAGVVTVFAGIGAAGTGIDGVPAISTSLNQPRSVAVDASGNVFIAEAGTHRIRMVTPAGIIYTIAGTGQAGFSGDGGVGTSAQIQSPEDLAVDSDGNVYVAGASRIRKLTPSRTAPPTITLGPRNTASGLDKVSPGAVFFVEGDNLAASEDMVTDPPWPARLGGSSMTIRETLVPLNTASPKRLSGQIPWDIAPGQATAVLNVNGVPGTPVTFEVLPAAPGIFASPENRAVAQNADGSQNSVENPAPAESEVHVFVCGFGQIDGAVGAGTGAPEDPVVRATLPFSVTVGDLPGEPVEITLVPGTVGVGKAKFRLPAGLAAGDHPVVIVMEGVASNAPVITLF